MIEEFDARTRANLEAALSRACERMSTAGQAHDTRSFIAEKLVQCARGGKRTLGALTEAGHAAVVELRARTGSTDPSGSR